MVENARETKLQSFKLSWRRPSTPLAAELRKGGTGAADSPGGNRRRGSQNQRVAGTKQEAVGRAEARVADTDSTDRR